MSQNKFTKLYTAYLDKVPVYQKGNIEYLSEIPYTRTPVLPYVDPSDRTMRIPVSSFLMGYNKGNHCLIYRQKKIDHENKKVGYQLEGLSTLCSWKPFLRAGPRQDYYITGIRWKYYQSFSKDLRVPRGLKTLVRKEIESLGEQLKLKPKDELIKSVLDNSLGVDVEKKILSVIPEKYLRGGYTYHLLPT